MKLLMVTPMPPRPSAPGAIPILLYAQLIGLQARHDVTLLTAAGPDADELNAVEWLRARGTDVVVATRANPVTSKQRWMRRWRLGSRWLAGHHPWRTIWFWEPSLQQQLDRVVCERNFDLIDVEDNACAIYHYPCHVPAILTEHEVRRPRRIDWISCARANPLHWTFRETDWRRWRTYQPRVWRKFERIQVFTSRDAARASALAPDLTSRLRVNPFGVTLPPVGARTTDEQTVLFIGNYTHPPNVDAAVWLVQEILPRIKQ